MKYGLLGEKLSHSYSPIVHKFVFEQLEKHPNNVAEIMVLPTDTVDGVKKRLIHNNICALKC